MRYPLYNMNCDDFEAMVVMICNHILGPATIPFAKGTDGGTIPGSSAWKSWGEETFTAGDWMWTRTTVTYSDGQSTVSYSVSRIGSDGERGYPGTDGDDGKTTYLHIKYSNNGGLSFTENNGETPGTYMGQYTDFEEWDSDDPTDYTWALIEGAASIGGEDPEIQPYYEYRYAKNGSRTTAPTIDASAVEPTGWTTTQPTVGTAEYLWQTIAQKRNIANKAIFHVPVQTGESGTLADTTGNGHTVTLGTGAVVTTIDSRVAVNLSDNVLATMVSLLPFGTNFTLCLWIRTDQNYITWLLNGEWGRNYVEKTLSVTANTWTHLALRFSEKGLVLFKDGVLTDSAALSETVVGFSMYDDNMFGSAIYLSDLWLMNGLTATADIVRIKNGTTTALVANWSTPIRITPYDGEDGEDGKSPALVSRGTYSSSSDVLYYGNANRVDCVKYNGTYYVARVDAPNGTSGFNVVPTNTNYWNTFGAQFESIATGLLLAEQAAIDNLIVRLLKTNDTGKRIIAENNILSMFDANNSQRLKITGDSVSVDTPTAEYPTNTLAGFTNTHTGATSGSQAESFEIVTFVVGNASTPVTIPALHIDVASEVMLAGGSVNSMTGYLKLETSTGTVISTLASVSVSGDVSDIDYAGGSTTLNAGTYVIKVYVNYDWILPSTTARIRIAARNETKGKIVVTSTAQQMVSVGANGMTIHLGNSFCVIFALDSSSNPMIRLQGTNSSNQVVGLDVSSAGVRINRGTGSWVAL